MDRKTSLRIADEYQPSEVLVGVGDARVSRFRAEIHGERQLKLGLAGRRLIFVQL